MQISPNCFFKHLYQLALPPKVILVFISPHSYYHLGSSELQLSCEWPNNSLWFQYSFAWLLVKLKIFLYFHWSFMFPFGTAYNFLLLSIISKLETFHVHLKKIYILLLLRVCPICFRSSWLTVLFKSTITFLNFCIIT